MDPCFSPPVSSVFDPIAQSDVSIDPLGLAIVYERLADRMLPGMTVRMRRPRFLTVMAVGACICAEYGPDDVAADGVTPPYLVFEWWIVEAYARASDLLADSEQIPGIRKVRRAHAAGRPVDAPAYLKTASVFGFTGIFRRLARRAQLITENNLLDEAGHRLVELWADEQGLNGFRGGELGPGSDFRSDLTRAVEEGMRNGRTGPRPGRFAESIATHLDPSRLARRERTFLRDLIVERVGESDEVRFITTALAKRAEALTFAEEADFLRSIRTTAPTGLAETLNAIEAYEEFCRPLTDAFNWLRYLASSNPQAGVTTKEFLENAPVDQLRLRLKSAIDEAAQDEILAQLWPERSEVFSRLQEIRSPSDLLPALISHHREVQRNKPPDGKRAWVEDSSHGRMLIRAAYRLEEPPADDLPYVHEYRCPTLSRFLADLGAFK